MITFVLNERSFPLFSVKRPCARSTQSSSLTKDIAYIHVGIIIQIHNHESSYKM